MRRELSTVKRLLPVLALSVSLFSPGLASAVDRAVIIGFKQRPGPSEQALIRGARGVIKRAYELIPAVSASLPEAEIARLKRDDRIAYVEENAIYRAAAGSPLGVEYEDSWGVRHIRAEVAHASGNRGAGVGVAILDTGIDYHHEDLDGNYIGGWDFVFDDADPFDDSFNSHGTQMAGIIAAERDGVGAVGVAPEVDLLAVKVLDGAGFGTADWIIAGIELAVRNGVEVINMSIEGPDVQALRDACDGAYAAGVLLVAAGGNSLAGGGPVEYPAGYDSVIAVTAIDAADAPGFFAPIGDALELAAPGVDVFTTVAGGGYGFASGTSQAAAHVSGAAALYLLANTQDVSGDGLVDHEDARWMLQMQAVDLGAVGRDEFFGYGRVDGAAAAFPLEMTLSASRTAGAPLRDAQRVGLASAAYEIDIANSDLRKLAVDVFEAGTLRRDLSSVHHFGASRPQRVVLELDASESRFSVSFTPYGRPGSSAEVSIRIAPEPAG